MADPIQEMLRAGVIPTASLPATSRYYGIGTATLGNGPEAITYFRRRLIPAPERYPLLRYVQIREGDRRDLVAHAQLGDAALWWRVADGQGVLRPADLEAPAGKWLRVTLPPQSGPLAGPDPLGGDDA